MPVHGLLNEPVGHASIHGEARRKPLVARRPRAPVLALDEQARGNAGLAPVGVHQAVQLVAEIRLHSRRQIYTPARRVRQRRNQSIRATAHPQRLRCGETMRLRPSASPAFIAAVDELPDKPKFSTDFDEPLIWIYDPRFPAATEAELAKDRWADFNRPMAIVDRRELALLMEQGCKIDFV